MPLLCCLPLFAHQGFIFPENVSGMLTFNYLHVLSVNRKIKRGGGGRGIHLTSILLFVSFFAIKFLTWSHKSLGGGKQPHINSIYCM